VRGKHIRLVLGLGLLVCAGAVQAAEDGNLGLSGVPGFVPGKPHEASLDTHWIGCGGFAEVPFESSGAHRAIFENLISSSQTFQINYELFLEYHDGTYHEVAAKRSSGFPNAISWAAAGLGVLVVFADLSGTRSLVEGDYWAYCNAFVKSFAGPVNTGDSEYYLFRVQQQ
jgi:hypothetical protein